jgi:tetratricopeptide (TPR) repeat protein
MWITVYKGTAVFLVFFTCFISSTVAHGSHEIDDIERSLSKEIVNDVEIKLSHPLSQADKGYAYFLLAVYKHDPLARDNAEKIYKKLASPESHAFLGSIEMLKARDLKSGGFFGSLMDIFKKQRYVQDGIEKIERTATDNPTNIDIKIVRAITYLELPSLFRKFNVGLEDIKTIVNWIQEGKVSVPNRETFFRDKSSIYYYAGRYFLKINQTSQAKEMFLKSSESSDQSPFAMASRKRLSR